MGCVVSSVYAGETGTCERGTGGGVGCNTCIGAGK